MLGGIPKGEMYFDPDRSSDIKVDRKDQLQLLFSDS